MEAAWRMVLGAEGSKFIRIGNENERSRATSRVRRRCFGGSTGHRIRMVLGAEGSKLIGMVWNKKKKRREVELLLGSGQELQ